MDHLSKGLRLNVQLGPQGLGNRQVQCDKHGPYTSTGVRYFGGRDVWSKCNKCAQDQAAREAELAVEAAKLRDRRRIEAMVGTSCIPERFIGRDFDSFVASTPEQKAALDVVRSYAEDFPANRKRGRGLVLTGQPGTGKSHLAASILQHIIPRYTGLYLTMLELVRTIRGTWRKDSEISEAQALANLSLPDLLVIDEIGVQYGTEGEQTILFDVLDRRYREVKPTILLTNENAAGLKTFIGERGYDRLVEVSRAVLFDWKSYRPAARKEQQ